MLRNFLYNQYVVKKQSVAQIAQKQKCSQNKINYWLSKHQIKKRNISDAIYQLRNPLGDPFALRLPRTTKEGVLFGMGIGLYWGEGTKRGTGGVKLGNTDAKLVRKFIEFLKEVFGVKKSKLRFGLQIFSDIPPEKALRYWARELEVNRSQFYKIIVSKVRGEGTYKYKSEYGVATVYFNNTKLKAIICNMIENIE